MAELDERVAAAFRRAYEKDMARPGTGEPKSPPVRYIVTVTLDEAQRERMRTFLHTIGAGRPTIRLAPVETKREESEGGVTSHGSDDGA